MTGVWRGGPARPPPAPPRPPPAGRGAGGPRGRRAAPRRAAGRAGAPARGAAELRRRGVVREGALRATGIEPPVPPLTGDWLVDPGFAREMRARLLALISQRSADPTAAPLSLEDARKLLNLPDVRLVPALL